MSLCLLDSTAIWWVGFLWRPRVPYDWMDHSPHLHPSPFYSPHQGRGAKRSEWETHLVYLTGALTKWWKAMTSANSCWFKLTTEGTTGKIKKTPSLKATCVCYLLTRQRRRRRNSGESRIGSCNRREGCGDLKGDKYKRFVSYFLSACGMCSVKKDRICLRSLGRLLCLKMEIICR